MVHQFTTNNNGRHVNGFCPSFQTRNLFLTPFAVRQSYCIIRHQHVQLSMTSDSPRETLPTNVDGIDEDDENHEDLNEIEELKRKTEKRIARNKVELNDLLEKVTTALSCSKIDHLPGIMTRNIDFMLDMSGYEGVSLLKEVIKETEQTGDEDKIQLVNSAIEYIMSFVEEFVNQAKSADDANKNLLGKIIQFITLKGTEGAERKEAMLDKLMKEEKQNFTPGFLRHLEGECQRIASAPQMTPESSKMLETMRIVQTRILEELGDDLGEGAKVLSQLLGYDKREERMAILDAGLTVRGIDFANELNALTKEALEGFKSVRDVDPDLVQIITEVNKRIEKFIGNFKGNNDFQ